MKNTPTAWLAPISEEEKILLSGYLRRQYLISSLLYIPVSVASLLGVLYLNNGKQILSLGDTERSIYNTTLVLAGIVCLRLFIGQTISFLKEKKAWQKKVMIRKIESIKNKNIFFINDPMKYKMIRHFDLHLRPGENIEVSTAEKLPIILSVKNVR